MIRVKQLQEYLETVKDRLESVGFVRVLIDDTDINKDLEKRSAKRDKHMIYAVMPKADPIGSEDTLQDKNYMAFLVVEKTDYNIVSEHDKWLELFADTQDTAIALRNLLIADKESGYEDCNFLVHLKTNTFHIEAVKWKAGTNGWMVDVDILNDL